MLKEVSQSNALAQPLPMYSKFEKLEKLTGTADWLDDFNSKFLALWTHLSIIIIYSNLFEDWDLGCMFQLHLGRLYGGLLEASAGCFVCITMNL